MNGGNETTVSHRFDAAPDSAAAGRDFLRDAVANLPVDHDALVLMGSEVITNAIRHARTAFTVAVSVDDTRVHVAVTDANTDRPTLREWTPDSPDGGLGMHLVERFAAAWGTDPFAGGKTVWFDVALEV